MNVGKRMESTIAKHSNGGSGSTMLIVLLVCKSVAESKAFIFKVPAR